MLMLPQVVFLPRPTRGCDVRAILPFFRLCSSFPIEQEQGQEPRTLLFENLFLQFSKSIIVPCIFEINQLFLAFSKSINTPSTLNTCLPSLSSRSRLTSPWWIASAPGMQVSFEAYAEWVIPRSHWTEEILEATMAVQGSRQLPSIPGLASPILPWN